MPLPEESMVNTKTGREQPHVELEALRHRVSELEKSEAAHKQVKRELENHQNQLEMTVQERTDQLKELNEKLRESMARRSALEAELKETEGKYRTTFQSANDILIQMDQKGKILDVNDKLKEIGGYEREELVGKNIRSLTKLMTKKSIGIVLKNFVKRMAGINVPPYEVQMFRSDGQLTTIEINAVALRRDGKIAGDLAILRDVSERKRAEEAMRASEELFKNLASSSPIGIFIAQDRQFRYVNHRFQELTGYREDELLGTDALRLVVPEDRDAVRENATKMLKGERSAPYEFRVINKSGEIRWIMGTVTSISYQGKRATLGNYMDITERKGAEDELAMKTVLLEAAAETTLDGIFAVDENDRIILYNKRFQEMFNVPQELITAGDDIPVRKYIVSQLEDSEAHFQDMVSTFADKERVVEVETYHKDGRVFANYALPLWDKQGNCRGKITYIQDITNRKQAEEALRASEELFKNLAGSSPVGIYIVQDKQFQYVNRRFQELTGYGEDELLGTGSLRLVVPEDRDAVTTKAIKMLRGERSSPYEFRVINKSGEIRWIMETVTSISYKGKRATMGNYMDITESRQAEQALADEAIRRRILVEQSSDGIVVLDESGKVFEANQRFAQMLGYTSEEIKNLSVWDWEFLFPQEQVLEMIRSVDEAGDHFETKHRRKDGSIYDVEISTNGATIAGNKLIFCVCRDITERKRAEEEIHQSQEKLATIFQSVGEGITVIDMNYNVTDANERALHLCGFRDKSDFLGRNVFNFVAPTEREHALADTQKLPEEEAITTETILLRQDGTEYPAEVSISIIKDANGQPDGAVTISRDITERKQAEDKVKHAAEEWRTTFDSITDPISIHDRDYRILRTNRAFADLFHMKPQQLIGKHCYELMHGTKEPPPNCPHKQTLETGKAAVAEFYEPHLGMYLLGSTSPIFDEKGEIVSTVHIARDITVSKQQEEQLIMTDRLASIGELVSGIAHELNNPLTSVIGFSQLLRESDVPPEAKDDLDVISKEAERAAKIVKNLLTFARKHEPVKQRSHVNNIIEDVIKLRAYEQKVNNITLRKSLARELPEIMADYFQMQQVFLNIIVNAEAAMVEAHKKGTLTISTRMIDGTIRISFTDDGPGITKENLNRIFNPFFTTKEVGKGTGLGLSICHGIVNAHGGKVYARSKPGSGATFVVELPVNSS
jgi:PAS domain S-box-containing protein